MTNGNTPSNASWPFPAGHQFQRGATTRKPGPEPAADDEHDHVEQELVDEQLERDRNAAKAVDSKLRGNDKAA